MNLIKVQSIIINSLYEIEKLYDLGNAQRLLRYLNNINDVAAVYKEIYLYVCFAKYVGLINLFCHSVVNKKSFIS